MITGTYCTPEIMKAIEKGYELVKIYEVYHWSKRSSDLFKSYVDTFLQIKQESSDYPEWVKTKEDEDSYVESYLAVEGIRLNKDSIQRNPGLRTVAKLALNSLWGKFGEKRDRTKCEYFANPASFRHLVNTKEVCLVHRVNESCLIVNFKERKGFEQPSMTTNEVIACFTTCGARLMLYDVIDFLGDRVLYMDTDSVIFKSREGDPMPKLGDYLGELTDELPPGRHIKEFISSGPKSYSYRLDDGKEDVKIKGVAINPINSHLVNFDGIKEMLFRGNQIQLPPYNLFVRDKVRGAIYNRRTTKTVKLVYTKRILLDNFDTIPFGYIKQ